MFNKSRYYDYINAIHIYIIGLVCVAGFHYTTLISLYGAWVKKDSIVSHGLLIFPLSIYLFSRELKSSYKKYIVKLRIIFLISLVGLSVIWMLANLVELEIVTQITFILILCIYTVSFFGIAQTGRLLFPLLLMLTAVPFWAYISPELQRPTAYFVNILLQITGYTSINEGVFIRIPEGTFEVSETCSGVRYQVAAITLTLLYIYLYRIRFVLSFFILAIASLLAFLSNIIRIYIVILSGHYSNMTHSLLDDHIWLGWVIFSIMILIFIISLTYIVNIMPSVTNIMKSVQYNNINNVKQKHTTLLAIFIAVVACTGSLAYTFIKSTKSQTVNKPKDIVLTLNGLEKTNPNDSWNPKWRSPDIEIRDAFSNDKWQLELYVSIYLTQEVGKEVVNELNVTHDKKRWNVINRQLINIEGTDYQELVLRNKFGGRRVVWKTYIIGDFITPNEILAKLYSAVSIFKGRQDAAVILLSWNEEDVKNTQKIDNYPIINDITNDVSKYLIAVSKG